MASRSSVVVVFLLLGLPSAWSKDLPFQIKVLSSETHKIERPVVTPPDCNWRDLSAYCYSSSPETYVENVMIIQLPDGKSLQIACTAQSASSRCIRLPINHTFEARKRKNALEIQYRDEKGRLRKQTYEIVGER